MAAGCAGRRRGGGGGTGLHGLNRCPAPIVRGLFFTCQGHVPHVDSGQIPNRVVNVSYNKEQRHRQKEAVIDCCGKQNTPAKEDF